MANVRIDGLTDLSTRVKNLGKDARAVAGQALRKGAELCGRCPEMEGCEKLKMITDNSEEALQNTLKIKGEKN